MFKYLTAGRIFCPRCFVKREFYVLGGYEQDPSPPVACTVCEYEYGKVKVEHSDGRDTNHDALSPAVRLKALEEYREDFRINAIASGYRAENFSRGKRDSE